MCIAIDQEGDGSARPAIGRDVVTKLPRGQLGQVGEGLFVDAVPNGPYHIFERAVDPRLVDISFDELDGGVGRGVLQTGDYLV